MPSDSVSDAMSDSHHELPAPSAKNADKHKRRRRLQLSCGECRKKKLSCDRTLPCQRCIRSGRPHLCLYESVICQPLGNTVSSAHRQQLQRNDDEIRDLRAEVDRLKSQLAGTQIREEDGSVSEAAEGATLAQRHGGRSRSVSPPATKILNPILPTDRSPRGYYNHHSGFAIYGEVPQLYPFAKEIVDEFLKPKGVHLSKIKSMNHDRASEDEMVASLEGLLPPKQHADILVEYYLDHFARLHRAIHIPTFKREYANFWTPGQARHPAMLALILSIISISAWPSGISTGTTPGCSQYRSMPELWIPACDRWIMQQKPKHRKLVHYQVACLSHLAKRINQLRKKRFWVETGTLVQCAVFDGLQYEPPPSDSPFTREMKRRVWAVIRELDLHNALEHGLPTLLHNIESDITPPANIDDDEFDETSAEIPPSKPLDQYTCTSYQALSARSWELRLDISRRLLSPGMSQPLEYDDILHYTHELTQCMYDVPSWTLDARDGKHDARVARYTHAMLQFQLKEYIFAMHRPYIQRSESKYWLSENVSYHMARDVLLLNIELAEIDMQSLSFIREDLALASTLLMRIGLAQPRDAKSVIVSGLESTIALQEQCLELARQRYLRCCVAEPWCVISACSTIMQLKMHLGQTDRQSAKAFCAQQLLKLHHLRYGKPTAAGAGTAAPAVAGAARPELGWSVPEPPVAGRTDASSAPQQLPTPEPTNLQIAEWLDSNSSNLAFDLSDFDMDMDGMWEAWNTTWSTQMNG